MSKTNLYLNSTYLNILIKILFCINIHSLLINYIQFNIYIINDFELNLKF